MELFVRVARRQATTRAATAAAALTSASQYVFPLVPSRASSTSQLQLLRTRGFAAQTAATGNLLQPRARVNDTRDSELFVQQRYGDADDSTAAAVMAVTDGDVAGSSVDALKNALMAPASSFRKAYASYKELCNQSVHLREKHYLSLVYKACREGRYTDVKEVFDAFTQAEANGEVILPPRADRTWNYLSFERLQLHRFVLWSMLDAKKYRQMNAFFRQHVHGRPNKWSLFESDPLNFLLRAECTGRFADEQDLEWKLRVDKILAKMEMWRFNASYSSSHALFRFLLYHPEVFIAQELARNDHGGAAAAAPNSTNANHSSLTLGDVFVRFFNRYTKALRRDPKRISIAVSAAAAAGQHDVVKAILKDAEQHTIRIDAVSFAHAVECAESEEKRMEIVELYVKAKERNAIYTTQDEPASISNYLLLYAIFDGNFRHMMELLHEMQLYNNAASNKTVEELFQSIAKYRAQIRLEDPENVAKLKECPTVEELVNDFPNVIPRNVHTITQGILQSLRSGDLLIALRLVRATVRTTDIVLRREIYAQLVYPLLARGSTQYDELELVELERFYDTQHPRARVYLNAQVLNLCESNEDFVATLACLDRWQLQRHAPLSRRALQRVFDIVSKQLQQLRQEDAPQQEGALLVEGMELSYLAFLKRYFDIIPLDAWTFGNAIIRSGTSGLHADLLLLLHQAHDLGLVLEKAAYKIAFQVLEEMGKPDEIRSCVAYLKENSGGDGWEKLVEKYPEQSDDRLYPCQVEVRKAFGTVGLSFARYARAHSPISTQAHKPTALHHQQPSARAQTPSPALRTGPVMHAPMPPPPMPRWPPLPTGAPPPLRMMNRDQTPFPPLPRVKAAAVQPLSSARFNRVWASGVQQMMTKRTAVLPFSNTPRPGDFQYQTSVYHQRAVQRQLWDSQSAREGNKIGLGRERENEIRYPSAVKTSASSLNRHTHRPTMPTRIQAASKTQQLRSGPFINASSTTGGSIWAISLSELSAMMQKAVHSKRLKRTLQLQSIKASRSAAKARTWHYVDDPQQLGAKTRCYTDDPEPQCAEDATSDEASTGDDSSDPEEDAPVLFRRFYALPYMLPPTPWPSADDMDERWDSGVSGNSTVETPAPAATQTVDALNYRKLFALSVNTPSFYPQKQPCAAAASSSSSKDREEDDPQLVRSKWLLMDHAAALIID